MAYGGIIGQQQNIDAFTKEETYSNETQAKYGSLINNPNKAFNILSNSVLYTKQTIPKYQEVTVDLSAVSVGDIVQLPEGGVLVDYLAVHIGIPDAALYDASCNGVWLLRKDIAENGQWNSSNVNTLPNSAIMTTMAGYLSKFPSEVQTAIKTVKIPYCVGNGSATVNSGANGLECKVFPLSGYELGWTTSTSSYFPIDGAKLSYFTSGTSAAADDKRVATLNGFISIWWLRSPNTDATSDAWVVRSDGTYNRNYCTDTLGIRPAFIMPTTTSFTFYVDNQGTVHDAQEYTQGGETTDVQGNPINIGAKIATGSYVGTGKYGASNKNNVYVGFYPKLFIVYGTKSTTQFFFFRCEAMSETDQAGMYGQVNASTGYDLDNNHARFVPDNGGGIRWWNSGNAGNQMNTAQERYYFFALG